MQPVTIVATDIPDAWFQLVYNIFDNGRRYTVAQGSFVGETRLEYDWVSVIVKHPYAEPYDRMLPQIPANMGFPNPVADGYVEQYLPYLMTPTIAPGEDYTYGSRISGHVHYKNRGGYAEKYTVNQVQRNIGLLKETPDTNQAILQVAAPQDGGLADPPCLRHVDLRVRDNMLIFYPSFRSWDLWGGFPANLAGLAVLQKYMADEIGLEVGPMCASSKGLHVYGYVEEIAAVRAGRDIEDPGNTCEFNDD